jgi:hypothetical protein
MPLIACPDCGRQISTAASACPHCGRPAQTPVSPPLPSSMDAPAHPRSTFFSRIPKTVLVICAVAVPGFVVGLFAHFEPQASSDPALNSLLNGLIGALSYSVCAAYIAALIFCWMKGKRVFAVIGVIMLFVPGMSLFPVIGAIRVARPNSTWARKYYGPEKMKIARERFPKDHL